MTAAVVMIFVMGVGNFAMHRAVFESGHPLLARFSGGGRLLGKRVALAVEFLVLVLALMLASNGWPGFAWAYLAYTGVNAVAVWLICSGKV